jgi:hypothetical protein
MSSEDEEKMNILVHEGLEVDIVIQCYALCEKDIEKTR